MVKGTTVSSVKDAIAVGSTITDSAKNNVVWLLPPEMLALAAYYGLPEKARMLIGRGGRVRSIFHITPHLSAWHGLC